MPRQSQSRETVSRKPAMAFQPVVDPAGWNADDMAESGAYLFHLTEAHRRELDETIRSVARQGRSLLDVSRADCPLPGLGPSLAAIRSEILDGRGFAQIRGFPVDDYSREQAATAFWCIALHLGERVLSQNAKGHLLGHVTDIGQTSRNPDQRGPYSSDAIPFHVDCSDVVGLMCLHPSRSGGESGLASSISVHNEMLKRRADLVRVLAEPFYRDRRGEVPRGMPPWYRLAVFHYNDGCLSTTIEPHYTATANRHPGVPDMTPMQREALAMVQEIAAELRLDIAFQAGDMQFLNNHVIMHTRSAYQDAPGQRRHLLRIWLANKGCRPLPAPYFERHGVVGEVDWPGGIVGPDTVLNAPLEPC